MNRPCRVTSISRGITIFLCWHSVVVVQCWLQARRVPFQQFQRTGWSQPHVSSAIQWHSTQELQAVPNPTSTESSQNTNTNVLRELYPPLTLRNNGSLVVDEVHTLHFDIYGDKGKLKALFLHGGPGAGCFPNHARFFNPEHYQVVLLDQRGCGRSTPTASLVNQTLSDIVQDCEALRKHVGLSHWDVVLGGSWGTTVAIAYAQLYPTSIRSVVLRGVCLLRESEIDWLFASTGVAKEHGQAWESFARAVDLDPAEIHYPRQVLHEYYERLVLGRNDTERLAAAQAWSRWELYNSVAYQIPPGTNISDPNATMQALESWKTARRPAWSPVAVNSQGSWSYQTANGQIVPPNELSSDLSTDDTIVQASFRRGLESSPETLEPRDPWPFLNRPYSESNSTRLPVQAILTCFYSTNDDYCRNNQNLLHCTFPTDMPCIAIQGGSDSICPPDSALDVLNRWPGMELRMPVHAGHSMYDPYITNEIIWATDRLARMLL